MIIIYHIKDAVAHIEEGNNPRPYLSNTARGLKEFLWTAATSFADTDNPQAKIGIRICPACLRYWRAEYAKQTVAHP